MLEKLFPFVLSCVATMLLYICNFNLGNLVNYKEIMSSAISMGSIAVGFLAAAITLMPSMSNNELVKNLKRMGAYKKLLKYIITAIFALFGISLFSILGLFINTEHKSIVNIVFYNIWIFLFVFSLLATYRVIRVFLKFLVVTQNDDS